MKDHLNEFENPGRDPVKTRRALTLYVTLFIIMLGLMVRAYYLWKKITHH